MKQSSSNRHRLKYQLHGSIPPVFQLESIRLAPATVLTQLQSEPIQDTCPHQQPHHKPSHVLCSFCGCEASPALSCAFVLEFYQSLAVSLNTQNSMTAKSSHRVKLPGPATARRAPKRAYRATPLQSTPVPQLQRSLVPVSITQKAAGIHMVPATPNMAVFCAPTVLASSSSRFDFEERIAVRFRGIIHGLCGVLGVGGLRICSTVATSNC